MTRSRTVRLALLLVIVMTWGASAAAGAADTFESPIFGIDFAPDGGLLVADAGQGIVRLGAHRQATVPLPGVTDVSAQGTGLLWATRGAGDDPRANTGQALFRVTGGKTTMVADLFAFEEAANPDGQPVDSNPFDVQALNGGSALVADAGANDLLRVHRRGGIDVLAVFPNELVPTDNIKALMGCPDGPPSICGLPPAIPAQAVPTSVAVGPDGHYYVGELKGFPAPVGESRIWRVAPDATGALCPSEDCQLVFDGGFTSIIDLAFGPDGDLYVAELDEASWAAVEIAGQPTGGTINRCDLGSSTCVEVATDLNILTAIAFAKDGGLWAAVNALIPGQADVVEVS